MAYDRSVDLFHLTPGGWVTRFDVPEGASLGKILSGENHDPEDSDPPHDRVETWLRRMSESSDSSGERVSWSCSWISPTHSPEDRAELHTRHGRPWHDFPE